jgi:hypothetical protein
MRRPSWRDLTFGDQVIIKLCFGILLMLYTVCYLAVLSLLKGGCSVDWAELIVPDMVGEYDLFILNWASL